MVSIFQMIPNSCATHALVSVLLNCEDKLHLGETFGKLKEFSSGMNPQVRITGVEFERFGAKAAALSYFYE